MWSRAVEAPRPIELASIRPWRTTLIIAAVFGITLVGLLIRLRDLSLVTVSFSIDEARLALVARGIQEHGWPLLPSGKVYTRGIPAALSMVPSLSIFGQSDFAARLPSVIFGVLHHSRRRYSCGAAGWIRFGHHRCRAGHTVSTAHCLVASGVVLLALRAALDFDAGGA